MARFLSNGELDAAYGTGGVSSVVLSTIASGGRHELLPDGSTRHFGETDGHGICLARDPEGQVITTFGVDGIAHATPSSGGEVFANGLTLPSGRIIGYGTSGAASFLAKRMTTDPVADALPVISSDGTNLNTTGQGPLQWFVDGTPIDGATGSSILPVQNGSYSVVMTLSPDCIYTSDAYELLNVGFKDRVAPSVQLVGNPVSDNLQVINQGTVLLFDLLDMRGRRLNGGSLQPGLNAIDVSSLAQGPYILRTASDRGIGAMRFQVD